MIRKFIASILILLGIASAIVSTYATVQPLSMAFTGSTKQIMVGMFVVVQLGMFFMAMSKHYIARETPQHFTLISRVSNVLIVVSIVGTITFLELNRHFVSQHTTSIEQLFNAIPFLASFSFYRWLVNLTVNFIFTWSVCIVLDVMAIKLPLIGFDLAMKIKHKRVHETLLSMTFAILVNPVQRIIRTKYDRISDKEVQSSGQRTVGKIVQRYKDWDKDMEQKNKEVQRTEVQRDEKALNFEPIAGEDKEVQRDEALNQEVQRYEAETVQRDDEGQIDGTKVLSFKPFAVVGADKVLDFLGERYKDGDKVNVSEVKETFGLSQKKWVKVRDEIDELVTKGTNTFYIEEKVIRV